MGDDASAAGSGSEQVEANGTSRAAAPEHRGANRSGSGARLRRRLPGRRTLPSSRALVGGVLVAVAMVASFAAAAHHDRAPGRMVMVARRPVALGTLLTAPDLARERVDLPPALARQSYGSPDELIGHVTVAPLSGGELIQHSGVVASRSAPELHELSFPLDRERALDGQLQPGQTVDLLATYGTGDEARTVVVARQVRLVDVADDRHQSLDATGKLVITVAMASADDALRATHASQAGAITLVRSDDPRAGSSAGSYSLPAPTSNAATTPTTG